MSKNSLPIGIFDSGCGGLGILNEVINLYPNENIIYYADTKNAPYGAKSIREVRELSDQVVRELISYGCKMVVVACNTASVSALSHLRASFEIPFVGVVPAIKVAAEKTTGPIGLLGTKRTLSDAYIDWLTENFAKKREIIRLEKNSLVHKIEQAKDVSDEVAQIKKSVKDFGLKSLVLGCTHFPLIKKELVKALPKIPIIDSDLAVAKQVGRILKELDLLNPNKSTPYRTILHSGPSNGLNQWVLKSNISVTKITHDYLWPRSFSILHNKKIHIIGIYGAGMSAIAQYLKARGAVVTGSDAKKNSEMEELLHKNGITTFIGHDKKNVSKCDWVIYSSAVKESNVEFMMAKESGIPILSRPDTLSLITRWHNTIAICGSHGKTTITSYMSALAHKGELPYSSIIGALVDFKDGKTNSHNRGEKYLILEADEYDRTFLSVRAQTIIVSSIDDDHKEIYPTDLDIQKAFKTFIVSQIPYPHVVLKKSDPGIKSILSTLSALNIPMTTIDLAGSADLTATEWKEISGGHQFKVNFKGRVSKSIKFYHPGAHNLTNILLSLGAMFHNDALFLEEFFSNPQSFIDAITPPKRRYEILKNGPVTLVDDFGHHPEEISQTVTTAKNQLQKGGRLWIIFQPHLYSRTVFFKDKLQEILSNSHRTLVLDIFASRESDANFVSSEILCQKFKNIEFLPQKEIETRLKKLLGEVRAGDTILCVGAGDLFGIPERLKTLL